MVNCNPVALLAYAIWKDTPMDVWRDGHISLLLSGSEI